MTSRYILMCLLLTGVSLTLKAQQLDPLQIIPFNSEQYENKFRDKVQMDSLVLKQDTLTVDTNHTYPMIIIDVPQNNMAKIPNMPIRQDVHYHMQIKKYNNCDGSKPPELQYKLLPEQKDNSTKNPPEK